MHVYTYAYDDPAHSAWTWYIVILHMLRTMYVAKTLDDMFESSDEDITFKAEDFLGDSLESGMKSPLCPSSLELTFGKDFPDEMFFDCQEEEAQMSEDTSKEPMSTDEEIKQGSQKLKETPPKRKKKIKRDSQKFTDYQSRKMDLKAIENELRNFQECCKLYCHLWITTQIILFCRSQYILQPCFEDRRTWLAKRMDEMEIGPSTFSYNIDVLSAERRRCCAKAWRFAYGVPEATHKRGLQRRTNGGRNNKKGKVGSCSSIATFFIVWLLAFANEVGDKLPFGEGSEVSTQIRLPFPHKKIVYKMYKKFEEQKNVTNVDKIISYNSAIVAWKEDPNARHIKLAKFKEGFSKCDVCSRYEMKITKQMTAAQRANLDCDFYSHLAETKKERQQYYKAKNKAMTRPTEYMSLIMDSMDQRKTAVPFFSNPPKSIASEHVLKTKLMATIIHGHGTYLFWTTDQIKHDTNFTIECLRRALLKYEAEVGKLPGVLYLQMDNGPDQKSKQFLAFLAYLVERNVFHTIKASYLIVGHTHEDIDQYFSCISRYIRKSLKSLLSIGCLLQAFNSCFKTPGCIPRCVEQVRYCYDTKPLLQFVDKHFQRFDLDEKTNDKVHYFVMKRDSVGKATMQYKLKRYSDAVYPRKFSFGDSFNCDNHGTGTIVDAQPYKDPIHKRKYWNYTVKFFGADGADFLEIYKLPADECFIVLFPNSIPNQLPENFSLAEFKGTFEETLADQKAGVEAVLRKLDFHENYPAENQQWQQFWESIPTTILSIPKEELVPFSIPKQQLTASKTPKSTLALHIDDGVRPVDVVTHSQMQSSQRKRKYKVLEGLEEGMDALKQGDFLVVDLVPDHSPWYTLPFLLAEIDADISDRDSTSPDCEFSVQIYRPNCSDTNDQAKSLAKKFVKWQGSDRKYWKPTIQRGMVLSTVSLAPQSKKLTKKSLEFIKKFHLQA